MELFLYLIGLAIWLVIVYVVTTYLTRRHYRPYWVQQGRDWRLKGYDRFISQYAWMKLYAVEFGMISLFMFVCGFKGNAESVISVGIAATIVVGVLTMILLFRITYLKGKGSR